MKYINFSNYFVIAGVCCREHLKATSGFASYGFTTIHSGALPKHDEYQIHEEDDKVEWNVFGAMEKSITLRFVNVVTL